MQTIIRIVIGDVNDNDPVFQPANYTVYISEETKPGSAIVNVTATDNDKGQNARISFEIIGGNEEDQFALGSHVCIIIFIRSIFFLMQN